MLLQDIEVPIHVNLPENRSYSIVFRAHAELPLLMREQDLRPGRCLLVTDRNVAMHYIKGIDVALQEDGWEPRVLVLPPGEQTKSTEHLQAIYEAALSWGIDRRTPIVAIGGGVIGDLTGYAASTLLRGVPLVHVPTSLIAQVDSAIGGKTGINREQGKNLIGTFYQPVLVCVEPEALFSLPRREWHSGLAEVVKHALISDAPFFDWIEDEIDRIVMRDPGVVRDMVYRAASIKAGIVSEDEQEQGIRAILNFGHTFGHALELSLGYGVFTHGEAVTIGMRAALYLSRRYNRKVDHMRAVALLERLPHPPVPSNLSNSVLFDAMQTDKKRDARSLRFVLLKEIGKSYTTDTVSAADVDAAWSFALVQA